MANAIRNLFIRCRRSDQSKESGDETAAAEQPVAATETAHEAKEATSRKVLLDEILASNLPPEEKATARVSAELGTIAGAAFETSANSLRVVLYHVYTSPRILNHLRAEIREAKLHADISRATNLGISALEQLPYLTSVLMEDLRLTPGIATRVARIAPDRMLWYEDKQISAGTLVGMTTLLMHMDPTIYPNPTRFNPERWMDGQVRKKSSKNYAPFSRGSSICLGMQ